ncbi:LOW QUALITY PROTEIN: hypothetical protein Cgig2_013155 [Carnegiea gigantea]|uniref:Uncharacterized protein n=1 Tax=Carnegiea gigantea TaxID=171969 RepID=A0A9Q1KR54_9CARY|nr:LOW QUALITY PROTEIN: hypothetical protein Cgig2_013155 [Carnegiea gigantea]
MEEGARPNVSDFFPLLRPLDLQGARRRAREYFCKILGVFEKIIDERLRDQMGTKDDVLPILLNLVKEDELSLHDVKHMPAVTNPTTVNRKGKINENSHDKRKNEKQRRPTEDCRRCIYIDFEKGTIEETMATEKHSRLKARNRRKTKRTNTDHLSQNCRIFILLLNCQSTTLLLLALEYKKRKTANEDVLGTLLKLVKEDQLTVDDVKHLLLVNFSKENLVIFLCFSPVLLFELTSVWSICRDPSVWANPKSFAPERFLESEIDLKGRIFELVPSGTGRMMRLGVRLTHRMVHLTLATLLHSFNWKLDHGLDPEDVDMEEKYGMTLQKPLQAISVSHSLDPLLAIRLLNYRAIYFITKKTTRSNQE